MTGKWIEMFRTGSQTDSAGNTRDWTEQDLDKIVQQYNNGNHEAPIVVGHPDHNSPAFGWVEALKREGALLYARLKDVMPEFEELVRVGTYKKRSISLYPDLTLRHIGFLGGMPPAVKGLANVFSGEDTPITYEYCDQLELGFWRRLKNWLIGKEGQTQADALLPEYELDIMARNTYMPDSPDESPSFNEPNKEETEMTKEEVQAIVSDTIKEFSEQIKATGDAVKGLIVQYGELTKVQEQTRLAGMEREFREFLESPEMQKRIPEGSREATVKQMAALVGADSIMFEEAGERKTISAVDGYKAQLKTLPEVVQFGEYATSSKVGDLAVNGMTAEALSQKAVEYQQSELKVGRTISMTEAVNHIKKGGK